MLWISKHFRVGTYKYTCTHGLAIGWLRIGFKIRPEHQEKVVRQLGFDKVVWVYFVLATLSLW